MGNPILSDWVHISIIIICTFVCKPFYIGLRVIFKLPVFMVKYILTNKNCSAQPKLQKWSKAMCKHRPCVWGSVVQGRSQPHNHGWARFPLSSLFLKFRSICLTFSWNFLIFFLILALRTRPPGKAMASGYATGYVCVSWRHRLAGMKIPAKA